MSGIPEEFKVFGVQWNPTEYQLRFDIKAVYEYLQDLSPTKRNIVGVAARIYDPLGLLSPVTISLKMFFQMLCKAKIGWDETLPEELKTQWLSLHSILREIEPVLIEWQLAGLSHTEPVSTHLVGFCDASQSAYAAVIYLRVMSEVPSVSIVVSKTRVVPLKPVTIPRLELLSALLLAKLINTIGKALEAEIRLEPPLCFTDSKIALGWIHGTNKEWKQFVDNRVVKKRRLVSPDCWYHCSGITNPADIPSRGLRAVDVNEEMSLWLKGPTWLSERKFLHTEEDWTVPDPCLKELRKSDRKSITLCVPSRHTTVIEVERFSTLRRLQSLSTGVSIRSTVAGKTQERAIEDIGKSYKCLIRIAQYTLPKNRKFESWKLQFDLFKDNEGIWRCGGRLKNADIPEETKFPIFLERSGHIPRLIVIIGWDTVQ